MTYAKFMEATLKSALSDLDSDSELKAGEFYDNEWENIKNIIWSSPKPEDIEQPPATQPDVPNRER